MRRSWAQSRYKSGLQRMSLKAALVSESPACLQPISARLSSAGSVLSLICDLQGGISLFLICQKFLSLLIKFSFPQPGKYKRGSI